MYISNLETLPELLAERRVLKESIWQALDACMLREYGIANFREITYRYFNLRSDKTYFALCRQIPSVRLEDIACMVGTQIMGYELLSLSFVDDSFSSHNHEKRSYLDVPWSNVGRSQKAYSKKARICDGEIFHYNGTPLKRIKLRSEIDALSVPDYHFRLRQKVFGSMNGLMDVSSLHREYVRAAKYHPEQVYYFVNHGSVKMSVRTEILQTENFRPPSSWYYPLYFSWFLDGSMVLLETYDNDLAEVGVAKMLFERTVAWLQEKIGWSPLVLKVPALSHEMLFLPQRIVQHPRQALKYLKQSFQGSATGNSVHFFHSIAKAAGIWRESD